MRTTGTPYSVSLVARTEPSGLARLQVRIPFTGTDRRGAGEEGLQPLDQVGAPCGPTCLRPWSEYAGEAFPAATRPRFVWRTCGCRCRHVARRKCSARTGPLAACLRYASGWRVEDLVGTLLALSMRWCLAHAPQGCAARSGFPASSSIRCGESGGSGPCSPRARLWARQLRSYLSLKPVA